MKILYYCTAYYSKHGGSTHARAFVECCKNHSTISEIKVFPEKNKQKVVSLRNNSLRSCVKQNPLLLILSFIRRNKFYLAELYNYIENTKPDIIHIRLDSNFLQIKKIKRRFPDLIITTEVNASPFDESFKNIAFKFYFKILERKSLKQSDNNFFVSKYLAERIMKKEFTVNRDIINPNGVDVLKFKPPTKVDNDVIRIGYVGTIDFHKKLDVLIEAFLFLKQKHLNIELILIGDGPALNDLRVKYPDKQMKFKGWVRHDNIPQMLSLFNIAIHHHALDYMCPLKLFEYMAVKVPCIGPNTPAVKELFQENVHYLSTNGEIEDLIIKIEMLINDKNLCEKLSENAFKLVNDIYTWENNLDRYLKNLHI